MSSITRIAPSLAQARTAALILALGALLAACAGTRPPPLAAGAGDPGGYRAAHASAPPRYPSPSRTPPSDLARGGQYKVGPPYQQFGVWYVPSEQPDYDEVGLASWYGDAFDGKRTANGETFDMRAVSAAHATLPMPCLVEVTNLENGRSLIVRLNDRGPYHPGRIIDLSRAGAQALGYEMKGTAKVRVRYVGPAPLDTSLQPSQKPLTFSAGPAIPPAIGAPTRLPPASPPQAAVATTGAYVVQAGVFSTRAAAERAASRLASAGEPTIRPISRGGQTLYKVVVGAWEDRGAALDARARIAELGFSDAWLSAGS